GYFSLLEDIHPALVCAARKSPGNSVMPCSPRPALQDSTIDRKPRRVVVQIRQIAHHLFAAEQLCIDTSGPHDTAAPSCTVYRTRRMQQVVWAALRKRDVVV